MVVINGQDTNSQSGRANLRNQGYYIDNTGVYSPGNNGSGNGQRVGDTFSGSNSNQNQPHNNVYLPLKNGTPQSPLSAQTYSGGQNGAVAVSDPSFASLFGPGSYFAQMGGPSNYGWMQGASGASNPTDFMSAITNYLNGATNTMTPQSQPSGGNNLMTNSVTNRMGSSSFPTSSAPVAQPSSPYTFNAGPTVSNNDYLMMLRQLYPSLYGAGSLTQH